MKPLFCNKGHHRVIIPKWVLNSNIKTEKGFVTINCSSPGCKGVAKYKSEVKEEIKTEEVSG